MFPLKAKYRIGYKHGQKTFYNAAHIGVDLIVPEGTPIYAPDKGKINTFFGIQGGQWISLVTSLGKHRFAHVKEYKVKSGKMVQKGELLGLSGGRKGAPYSGNSTTAHVHWDTETKEGFINPLGLTWEEGYDIPGLFNSIWKRKAAKGEIAYFERRIAGGSIKSVDRLKDIMAYWYSIVYPGGVYSTTGDARWQREKKKY